MIDYIELLENVLQSEFMLRALLAGIIIAILNAILGVYVTLKRESLIADAIAHGSLAGIAFALIISASPLLFSLLLAILISIAIVFIRRNLKIPTDSSLGIVFPGLFALGIVLLSLKNGFTPEITSYLFGNLLAVTWTEVVLGAGVLAIVLLSVIFAGKNFLYLIVSEELAKLKGVNTALYEYLLAVLVGLAIVISVKLVGIVLVTAILVIPAVHARLWSRKFADMMPLSVIHNVTAVVLGLLLSLKLPPGATIVVVSAMIFLIAAVLKSLSARLGR